MDELGLLEELMETLQSTLTTEETIKVLLLKIDDLTKALDHESSVNDKYLDQNIELKRSLSEIKTRTKVQAHPSTIKTLTEAVRCSEQRVMQLQEALVVAITLIPELTVNRHMLERLRNLARSY